MPGRTPSPSPSPNHTQIIETQTATAPSATPENTATPDPSLTPNPSLTPAGTPSGTPDEGGTPTPNPESSNTPHPESSSTPFGTPDGGDEPNPLATAYAATQRAISTRIAEYGTPRPGPGWCDPLVDNCDTDPSIREGTGLVWDTVPFRFDFMRERDAQGRPKLWSDKQCITFLPAIELRRIGELSPEMRLCIQWISFPRLTLFYIRIPIDLIILPFLMMIAARLWRL